MLDYIALGILIFVGITIFYGIIAIHDIPYEISKHRNHPHRLQFIQNMFIMWQSCGKSCFACQPG